MTSLHAAGSANPYCQRLGLPVPDLDTAVQSPDVTIAQLMALAVLEAGGPLTLEAIAERLQRLDLPPRLAAARNLASLRRAWHGQPPLVRDAADGRFYLDLLAHHDIGRRCSPFTSSVRCMAAFVCGGGLTSAYSLSHGRCAGILISRRS
jgi:hypothetical protein